MFVVVVVVAAFQFVHSAILCFVKFPCATIINVFKIRQNHRVWFVCVCVCVCVFIFHFHSFSLYLVELCQFYAIVFRCCFSFVFFLVSNISICLRPLGVRWSNKFIQFTQAFIQLTRQCKRLHRETNRERERENCQKKRHSQSFINIFYLFME